MTFLRGDTCTQSGFLQPGRGRAAVNTSQRGYSRPPCICLWALSRSSVLESTRQPGGFFLRLIGLGALLIPPALSLSAFIFALASDHCETGPSDGKAELWLSAPGSILANWSLPTGRFHLPKELWRNLEH